jgi:hypothetical protein
MPSGDIQRFHNIGTKTSINIRRILLVLLPNFGRNLLMPCFNNLSWFFSVFSVGTRLHADRQHHCLAAATLIVAATKDVTTDTSQHVDL